MKIISDAAHAALTTKAESFDTIVQAIVADNPDVDAADITAQTVIDALATSETATDSDNSKSLQELQTALDTANQTIAQRDARIAELENSEAAQPASIAPQSEPGAADLPLDEFANANAGNTAAILERAKAEGLI